jgi:hypothetical protein
MKGIQGLLIAVVLGLVGFGFNMVYLNSSRDFDHASFIGVRRSASVKRGTPLTKSHLEKITIPKEFVGNLNEYALPWNDLDAIVGRSSIRNYDIGGLLLRNDFRTARDELQLLGKETAVSVPIDTRTTIPSQIIPGDTRVSFYLPSRGKDPARGGRGNWTKPFDVLSVGLRMGSNEVINGQRGRSSRENMLTLMATNEDGKTNPEMTILLNHLADNNFKPLRLKLHAPHSR